MIRRSLLLYDWYVLCWSSPPPLFSPYPRPVSPKILRGNELRVWGLVRGSQRLCPLRVPIPALLGGQHDQGLRGEAAVGAERCAWGRVASSAAPGWRRQRGSLMSLAPSTNKKQTGKFGHCLRCVGKGDVHIVDVSQRNWVLCAPSGTSELLSWASTAHPRVPQTVTALLQRDPCRTSVSSI